MPTDSPQVAPDLKSAAETLASSIQNAMASLHSLQVSMINTYGSAVDIRPIFQQIRPPIKQEWERLLVYLQKCIAFGGKVVTLESEMSTSTTEDCAEFLEDMRSTATALEDECNKILQAHEAAIKNFGIMKPNMERFLRETKPRITRPSEAVESKPRGNYYHSGDHHRHPNYYAENRESHTQMVPGYYPTTRSHQTEYEACRPHGSFAVQPRVPERDKETQAFVEANMAAAFPSGIDALSKAELGLVEINSILDTISRFWRLTAEACTGFLPRSPAKKLNISPEEAKQLVEIWNGYQQALMQAITSITQSCDAMSVEPVGAQLTHRRSAREPPHHPSNMISHHDPYRDSPHGPSSKDRAWGIGQWRPW